MMQLLTSLIEKATGNPVGIVLALVALVLYKGGEAMPDATEPVRTVVMGIGGALALLAGAWVGRSKPPEDKP